MEIKPTSTTRTHRGKRLVRSLTLTGALIVVASLTMLNATASRTSASNVTVTADGTQMALMTEPPQDGTSVQREAWRESVLADPNVLGDNAPEPLPSPPTLGTSSCVPRTAMTRAASPTPPRPPPPLPPRRKAGTGPSATRRRRLSPPPRRSSNPSPSRWLPSTPPTRSVAGRPPGWIPSPRR